MRTRLFQSNARVLNQCFCDHTGRRARIIGNNKGFGRRKTAMRGPTGFPSLLGLGLWVADFGLRVSIGGASSCLSTMLNFVMSATKPGLLNNQGEKSINFYFIRVPLRKKVLKYGTPKRPEAGRWRIDTAEASQASGRCIDSNSQPP